MGWGEKCKAKNLMDRANDNLVRKAKTVCTNHAKRKIHYLLPVSRADVSWFQGSASVHIAIAWNDKHLNYNHSTLPSRRQLYNLSGQSVLVFFQLQSKKSFPCLDGIFCVFQFVTISSCPDTGYHCKESGPIFFTPTLMILECSGKIPSQPSQG